MSKKNGNVDVARSPDGFGVFKNQETDWVFKRTLAYMSEKAAEIGECLYAANNIDEKDGESWMREWAALAQRVEKQGQASLAAGHRISARGSFLRASNYYRTAEYGTSPVHPRAYELWQKSVECFRQACPLYDPPVQIIEIPFAGCMLPGYFWTPDNSGIDRPTLIAVGGNDSSGEEIFFSTGPGTIRHGYNYFTFEYPGHRGAVHLNPACVKRPDYELPFKAAIDYLETLPGVDQRLALAGFSFGGYVSSRVAVHEPRIQALIPDSPIVDLHALAAAFWGPVIKALNFIPQSMRNTLMKRKLRRSPMKKALAEYSMWTWGMSHMTILDWVEGGMGKPFNIVPDLPQITCAALALVSEDEGPELIRQARLFYENIGSAEKKIHIFTREKDGSNDHCQLDNISRANQVIFDWLDEIFAYNAEPVLPVMEEAVAVGIW